MSLLIDQAGQPRAQYGYTAYGEEDSDLSAETGPGGGLTTEKQRAEDPQNAYRYTAKRFDSGAGDLDLGARRFSPGIGRFLQEDYYAGALDNLGLSADPLTANRYSLAGGNPVSFVEVDGHMPCPRVKECGGRKAASQANGAAAESAGRVTSTQSTQIYDAAGNPALISQEGWPDVDVRRTRPEQRRLTGAEQAIDGSVWTDLSFVTGPITGGLRYIGANTIGRLFGGASRGAGVGAVGVAANSALRAAADPVEDALFVHVTRAVSRLQREGLTAGQRRAVRRRPQMEPLFRGERIDQFVRESIPEDPLLRHLQMTPRGQRGPDLVDPRSGRWYDITTPGAWQRHVDRYTPDWGPDGVGIVYR